MSQKSRLQEIAHFFEIRNHLTDNKGLNASSKSFITHAASDLVDQWDHFGFLCTNCPAVIMILGVSSKQTGWGGGDCI